MKDSVVFSSPSIEVSRVRVPKHFLCMYKSVLNSCCMSGVRLLDFQIVFLLVSELLCHVRP